MGNRWAIASDPRLLARIAEQDRRKGAQSAIPVASPLTKLGPDARQGAGKKEPSAATKRALKVALNNQDSRLDLLHYDEACNTLTIVLVGAELLSHNTSLRMHNVKAAKLKTTWLKRIEALMLTNLVLYDRWKENQKGAFPLVVEEVYATGENNCLDVESVTAACKPIIDALVRVRFIPETHQSTSHSRLATRSGSQIMVLCWCFGPRQNLGARFRTPPWIGRGSCPHHFE